MQKTTLKIDGMMCTMCESHVNDAIRNRLKVKKVTSSYKKGETEILSEQCPEEAALRGAVEDMGYKVLEISTVPYEKKGFLATLFKR